MKIEDVEKAKKICDKIHFIDDFLNNKDCRMELRYYSYVCAPCFGCWNIIGELDEEIKEDICEVFKKHKEKLAHELKKM